ncbi:RagB/SusD family nutrient uptake outer membrane protein [Pedobacter sp. ISL-68]|uniref:RagB/SusD family nutrient uptake outer membrane protein n=1 Tax=unclassified Pedobacter TaxID=2628915 RepID=UPI001BE62B33|nr:MULTISPECIES: RagB/SusD family nutrient uptake outer membrane protein [unclassified Pedobacter]MBT2560952.1 RagB/SusD family nutrient uptake outer membrane protein [Pedobacter sp. ISL-64]MBT2590341.1 RagB/SusD family nutrient uptake outer membrane protein [Pedobacter sp. ISL-68]
MKLINKIFIILLCAAAIVGCKKSFLDRPSNSQISSNNFYKTTADVRLATASLYGGAHWWQWNNGALIPLGDILSGTGSFQYSGDIVQLFTRTVTPQNGLVTNGWVGLYNTVAQCNTVISAIQQQADPSISEADKNAATAEAKFVRAMAYYNLAIYWGAVPIIEDNSKLIKDPLLNRNIVSDVYKFVAKDLTYAAQHLPKTDQKGRVTTWSAQGMLGKVYLTMAGVGKSGGVRDQALLDSAKKYAGNVCKNSALALFPSYYDLFKVQNNDNPESLFALQWAAGVGYGNGNALQGYFSPSNTLVPQQQGGWQSLQPTYDLYRMYSAKDTVRRKATIMLRGDLYPELLQASGGYKATGTGLKKHIIGNEKDNNSPTMDMWSSPEHNAMLRLADVYLVYAEAILGNNSTTSDADALKYFNAVRTRAGVDIVTAITPALLRTERRVELAFEGQYWTDLVRYSYYDPANAVKFLNDQDVTHGRISFTYDPVTKIATRDTIAPPLTLPATISSFTLPIPSSELTTAPKLAEPPVPYY